MEAGGLLSCCDRSRSRSDIRLLPRDGRLDSGDSVQILSTDLRRHGSGSGHQSKTPRIARHSTAEPLERPPQLNEGVSEGATPRLSMQKQTCGLSEKRSVSAIAWAKSPGARPPVSPDHRRRSASRYAILISAARRRAGLRARQSNLLYQTPGHADERGKTTARRYDVPTTCQGRSCKKISRRDPRLRGAIPSPARGWVHSAEQTWVTSG